MSDNVGNLLCLPEKKKKKKLAPYFAIALDEYAFLTKNFLLPIIIVHIFGAEILYINPLGTSKPRLERGEVNAGVCSFTVALTAGTFLSVYLDV